MGIVLVTLLAVCSLAVDLVHGYVVAVRAQNAADSAALGGTVFLPTDPSEAYDRALSLAADNGFADGVGGAVVTPVQQANPTQLKVEVKQTVRTWFAKVIGFDTLTVRKTAVADYDQPVAMGSPANTFGNQPDCVGTCTNTPGAQNPQLWFNLAGTGSRKIRGDAHLASRCTAENLAPDNCGGSNTDFDAAGYSYIVHNETAGGNLRIDVFDPGFVHVADKCDDPVLLSLWVWRFFSGDPDFDRFRPGSDQQWCTGDQYFGDDGSTPPAPATSYRVFFDPGTPWTSDDDVLQAGCALDFPGFVGDLVARWRAEASNPALPKLVSQGFRKWVTLCSIPAAPRGDYRVQAFTTSGSGHNRGALRVAKNGSLSTSDVSVFARGRMSLYANRFGATTEFYLARVLPGASGRTLRLTFFDTGDADQPGQLTVVPPPDATVPSGGGTAALTEFSNCRFTRPTGNATGPPWGSKASTDSGCSVAGVHKTQWNGQWIEWEVPIPPGYSCNFVAQSGCWVRLSFRYPAGSGVSDTTTWSASLDGNPVRLVS